MNYMGHNFQAVAGNWIAVSRDVRDHHLVGFGQSVKPANPKKGAFSRAEAWLDLIMLARWKDGPEVNKGRKIDMLAGQLQGGYSFLADRWNWTLQTVRTFISKLIGERMIERVEEPQKPNKQTKNQTQVLSVCNYKRYQLMNELLNLQDQQAGNRRATSEQQDLNKENKHTDARAHTRGGDWPDGDFVEVNGEAIYVSLLGRRLKFEYAAIDQWAALGLCKSEVARQIVEAEARGWVAEQKWPEAPSRWLQRQISNWRVHKAVAEIRIENERKRAPIGERQVGPNGVIRGRASV